MTILNEAEQIEKFGDIDNFNDLEIDIDELEEHKHENHIDFSWIKSKTGAGSIEDYIDHPLNINASRPLAQILRGATGIFGSLDLAVVDIGIGFINAIKEHRNNEKTAAFNAGE